MVGIAAGIPNLKEDRELGDVIVADQVIGYEHVKVTDKGYEYREQEYPASKLLMDRVRNFWDASWANKIAVPRPDNAKRSVSKLAHLGQLPPAIKSSPQPNSVSNSRHVGPNWLASRWKPKAFSRLYLIALRFATR